METVSMSIGSHHDRLTPTKRNGFNAATRFARALLGRFRSFALEKALSFSADVQRLRFVPAVEPVGLLHRGHRANTASQQSRRTAQVIRSVAWSTAPTVNGCRNGIVTGRSRGWGPGEHRRAARSRSLRICRRSRVCRAALDAWPSTLIRRAAGRACRAAILQGFRRR